MDHSLLEKITSMFYETHIDMREGHRVVITAKQEAVLALLSLLRNNGYNHLGLISCVDRIDQEAFELVYILSAYMKKDLEFSGDEEKTNIVLKTKISRENPRFLTVVPIFKNAEPYEREIHELYGIHFEGHPRLTPLFLERKYEIPPFRKDFDTRHYVNEFFDNIPFVEKKADTK